MPYRQPRFTGYHRAPYTGMFHDGAAVGLPYSWVILGAVACTSPPGAAIEVCNDPPGPVLPRYTEWRPLPAMSAPPNVAGYALARRWRDVHTRRAWNAHPRDHTGLFAPGPAPRPRDRRGRFAPLPDAPPCRWPNGAPAR